MKNKPTPQEQAKEIERLSRHLARLLADADLAPRFRVRGERQLSRALKALEAPEWKLSTLQRSVVMAIQLPALQLAKGVIDADTATRRAADGLKSVMSNSRVPLQYRGGKASTDLVFACLESLPSRGGRGNSKYDALRALFVALGIGRGGPTAIKQLLQRRRLPKYDLNR